jgi:hypothetical protein
MGTCFEATATVVASAENLAVSHGYRAQLMNWSEVHWDWRARRLMEAAYNRACAERGDCPSMLPEWRACEARMRAAYEGPS